jgi:amino acid transporter
MMEKLKALFFGKAQNPLDPKSRQHIALIAFLAWIGLGADGLSSSCYGPALGFLALHQYRHLALFLALLTFLTVFIIALSYNKVIELFPNGGGGYKVAKELLGPLAGVISGSALLIDYMLTITISAAAAINALYSLMPSSSHGHMVLMEILLVLLLIYLNSRGMKESIKFLMPIFLGFFATHIAIIVYGIAVHGSQLPSMIHQTITESKKAVHFLGFGAVIAILLRAYSLGSGTYTGLEAVSNNVNVLAAPRVKTGKWTMMYMASSLSLIAGGIIVLYLLWHVQPVNGMTLNAVVFRDILGTSYWGHIGLVTLLIFEAGLLFVGANTGFLGGPAVLANMAQDDWVPRRFTGLSTRLVKQNGILFFGVFSIITLILTQGHIELLVIFYSINVFVTFSVSLLGLMVYWWKNRTKKEKWLGNLLLSTLAFSLCVIILLTIIISKIGFGSWMTLLFTSIVVLTCINIKKRYKKHEKLKRKLDKSLELPLQEKTQRMTALDSTKPTAVFLIQDIGAALHTILWVERMFPKHFKNYIFVSYGWVDTDSFGSNRAIKQLQKNTERVIDYLQTFALNHGIACDSYRQFGTDPIEDVTNMAKAINDEYDNAIFFSSRYVYQNEKLINRMLHSDFSLMVQRRLQNIGTKMLIIPLTLDS